MKDDLQDLRKKMDSTIYKNKKFSPQRKQEVMQKVKNTERGNVWIPRSLTTVFLVAFLGLGLYLTMGSPSEEASLENRAENEPTVIASPDHSEETEVSLESDLPINTLLELTDAFKANLSIPLNLRELLPAVESKPAVTANTLHNGYRTHVTYPMNSYTIELIESVETEKRILEELNAHVPIAADQQTLDIKGHPAFYSEDQKELHIFTEERYFTVYGAEKNLLMEIADLIELDKPLAPVELKEMPNTAMETVELSQIEQSNYIPADFHKRTEFLREESAPLVLAAKGETSSSIRNHYSSPLSPTGIIVEQLYDASGKNYLMNHISAAYDIVQTVQQKDRTLFLMTDGMNYGGYFETANYSFWVNANQESITLDAVEEILSAIQVEGNESEANFKESSNSDPFQGYVVKKEKVGSQEKILVVNGITSEYAREATAEEIIETENPDNVTWFIDDGKQFDGIEKGDQVNVWWDTKKLHAQPSILTLEAVKVERID